MQSMFRTLLGALALMLSIPASATLVHVDSFPSAASTRFTQIGTRFWNDGDFVEQLFTGTGLTEVNEVALDLSIGGNSLSGDTQDMSVFLNGVLIGDYMIGGGDTLLNLMFTGLSVAGMGGGDDYLLRLETTRTVTNFAGSAGIANGTDNLRLTQVPEPVTVALLGLGLAGIGYSGRRRARAA